jgi:tryptophan 2,3-dioxygenase
MNNLELMLINLRTRRETILEYASRDFMLRIEAVALGRQINALEEASKSKDTELTKIMALVDAYRDAAVEESWKGAQPPEAILELEDAFDKARRELIGLLKTII